MGEHRSIKMPVFRPLQSFAITKSFSVAPGTNSSRCVSKFVMTASLSNQKSQSKFPVLIVRFKAIIFDHAIDLS